MGVKDDGAGRAGGSDLAEDDGVGVGIFDQLGGNAALFEEGADELGVAADVGAVGGDVWYGEEVGEFSEDGAIVILTPLARGRGGGIGLRGEEPAPGENKRDGTEHECHYTGGMDVPAIETPRRRLR